jgi:hypothetical protein
MDMPHDPNYRWRVLGALGTILITTSGIVLAVKFSSALSASAIIGLFGMEFSIVLITVLLVFQYPSTNQIRSAKQSRFSMDNPFIAVPFSMLSGILTALFIKWLSM